MSNLYGYSDYNGPDIANIIKPIVQQQTLHHCHHHKRDITATSSEHEVALDTSKHHHYHHHYDTPYQTDTDDEIHETDIEDNNNNTDYDVDDTINETNPLQAGFWMEGDSLAPPCGTSVSTIHKLLEIAFDGETSKDPEGCLYDLGCGDGRVCFEAYAKFYCPITIGVEIESDLIERARYLCSKLPSSLPSTPNGSLPSTQLRHPRFIQADLRQTLQKLITLADTKQSLTDSSTSSGAVATSTSTGSSIIENLPLPTIIVLYLLPEALVEIQSQLIELLQKLPNLKIICNTWGFKNLKACSEHEIREPENSVITPILVYTKASLLPAP